MKASLDLLTILRTEYETSGQTILQSFCTNWPYSVSCASSVAKSILVVALWQRQQNSEKRPYAYVERKSDMLQAAEASSSLRMMLVQLQLIKNIWPYSQQEYDLVQSCIQGLGY